MPLRKPIIGASVVVVNTTNGCITDFDGKFSLEVSQLPVKVQITYIGYKSQVVTVSDAKTVQVVLQEDTETLDEVKLLLVMALRKSQPDRCCCFCKDG